MICAARNEAEAVSAAQRSVRPERSEDAQMVAAAHKLGSLCLGRASAALGAVSHGVAASEGGAEPKQLFKTTDGIDQSTRQKSLAR